MLLLAVGWHRLAAWHCGFCYPGNTPRRNRDEENSEKAIGLGLGRKLLSHRAYRQRWKCWWAICCGYPPLWGFPPWQPTTSVATAGVAFCLNQLAPGLHYSPIISKLGKVSWALTTVRSWVRSKVASSNLRMKCLGWLLGTRMLNPVHLASLRS